MSIKEALYRMNTKDYQNNGHVKNIDKYKNNTANKKAITNIINPFNK